MIKSMNIDFRKALEFEEIKDYDSAIDCYNKFLVSNNSNSEVYVKRGDIYNHLKKYDNAISDYSTAISLDPENPVYYHKKGSVNEILENYVEALNDYYKAYNLCLENKKYKDLSFRYWNDCDDIHHLLVQKNKEA